MRRTPFSYRPTIFNLSVARLVRARLVRASLAAAALMALPLAAAADDIAVFPPDIKTKLDSLADSLKLRAKEGHVPDFVKMTRPDKAKLKFVPVGLPHPIRPLPVKTSSEVEELKAKLDAAAAAQLQPHEAAPPVDLVHKIKSRAGGAKAEPDATN